MIINTIIIIIIIPLLTFSKQIAISPPYWWAKTKDLSLTPFVGPIALVHYTIAIYASRDWLQTTFCWELTAVFSRAVFQVA